MTSEPSIMANTAETPESLSSVSNKGVANAERIRSAAAKLLEVAEATSNTDDLVIAVEKAAISLKLAGEIEKTYAEIEKFQQETIKLQREHQALIGRERSERLRDYIGILTPGVTILTLAATLIAQGYQFSRSEEEKRTQSLEAQWREAIKAISASGQLSPAVVQLQPFLGSDTYRQRARDISVDLLSTSTNLYFFDSLFNTAVSPKDRGDLDPVIRLDRALLAKYAPLILQTYDKASNTNIPDRLKAEDRLQYDYCESVLPRITAQVGAVLRRSARTDTQTDLSSTYFFKGDWSAVNLGAANLNYMSLRYSILKDADLSLVTQFESIDVHGTAWWQAKAISKPLLKYLEEKFPFDPKVDYGPGTNTSTQSEYHLSLKRLQS